MRQADLKGKDVIAAAVKEVENSFAKRVKNCDRLKEDFDERKKVIAKLQVSAFYSRDRWYSFTNNLSRVTLSQL
jgi:hypothetical protein